MGHNRKQLRLCPSFFTFFQGTNVNLVWQSELVAAEFCRQVWKNV